MITFSLKTLGIMTLGITNLSTTIKNMTLSITKVMLRVTIQPIILNVVTPNAVMLSVVAP